MEQNYRSQILIGVVAFGAGLGLGYLLGIRKKEPTYQVIPPVGKSEEAEPDIPTVVTDDNREAAKAFIQEVVDGKHPGVVFKGPADESEDIEPVAINIFTNEDIEWNYEAELASRNPSEPYVIHRDEFFANEKDYFQGTLTYYGGDDILVDEDNQPIYNHSSIIGDMLFGKGSGDPNVFYVRNDKRKAEFEICHDPGMYAVEVMGIVEEPDEPAKGLQHSGVPKFRDG